MRENDKKQFMQIIGTLAELYNRKTSPLLLKLYWLALQDLDLGQIKQAAVVLMNTKRFFPRPVEFRELIHPVPDVAELAWQQADEVMCRIRTHGHCATAPFDDPVTEQIVDSGGGYGHLCATLTEREEKWWRKDFVARYKGISESAGAKRVYQRIEASEKVKRLAAIG